MQVVFILLVSITLAEMMFAMGLRLSFSELIDSLRSNRWLAVRALTANYLVIPGVTILIIEMFHLSPPVAAGLLILGVSPAAPYGLPFTIFARGNFAISTGLMVILAGTSVIMAPLLLHFFLPVVSNDNFISLINPVKLTVTLFVIQFLPLFAGSAVRQWHPGLSSRMLVPAGHISKVLNLLMIGSIVVLQFKVMTGTGIPELSILLLLVVAGLIAGWIFGWPGKGNRVSVSIITAMRNMSLSMGIAVTSFPGSPVVTTILAYSFVAGTGVLAFAYVCRLLR